MVEATTDAGDASSGQAAGAFGADDPYLAAFIGYWRSCVREAGRLPTLAEVNPVSMPALLTRMVFADAPVLGRICRIHAAGLAIEAIHGAPLAGYAVDTGRFAAGEDSLLARLLRAAPRCRGLVYGEGSWLTLADERLFGRGVGAPLGDGGARPTGVAVCLADLAAAETAYAGGMVAALDGPV